jgi:uncharacterized protein (TIRG00374 family)
MMRAHLRTLLIIACTVGLLALFLRQADLGLVAGEIRRASWLELSLGLAFTALLYVFRAARWRVMLLPVGYARYSTAFRTTVIGFAANALLPARAGEFLRPYLLARREGLRATATFATVILERLLDVGTVLLLLAAFVFLFDPGMSRADSATYAAVKFGGALAGVTSLVGLVVMFVLAGHPERLEQLVHRVARVLPPRPAQAVARFARTFAEGLAVMRRPGPLAWSLLLSLPLWLCIAASIWFVSRAFHVTMPFTGSFLVIAVLTVGVAVPTPGAVGGFHYAYRVAATSFFGVPNERAVGAAIVLHAVSFVPVTVLGLIYMFQDGLSLTRARDLADEERRELDEARARERLPEGAGPGEADVSAPGRVIR